MADDKPEPGKAAKKRGRAPVVPLTVAPQPRPAPLAMTAPVPPVILPAIDVAKPAAPAAAAPTPAATPDSDPDPAMTDPVMLEPAPAPAVATTPSPPEPVHDETPASAAPATMPEPGPSKGLIDMATAFQAVPAAAEATDKAKAVFGDINGRAKAAMEKSAKIGEDMTELTKGNVEAIVQSGRVAAKGVEAMAQDAAETMKKNFEAATATIKSMAAVKSPTELFQIQSEAAKSYFDSAVADFSKFTEQFMKLAGDVAQPLSSRYSVAVEKVKASAL